jgi:hypothetical protein
LNKPKLLIYFSKPSPWKPNTKSPIVFKRSEKSNQIIIIGAYAEIVNHETPLIRFKVNEIVSSRHFDRKLIFSVRCLVGTWQIHIHAAGVEDSVLVGIFGRDFNGFSKKTTRKVRSFKFEREAEEKPHGVIDKRAFPLCFSDTI